LVLYLIFLCVNPRDWLAKKAVFKAPSQVIHATPFFLKIAQKIVSVNFVARAA
jgi:hypothetical protein